MNADTRGGAAVGTGRHVAASLDTSEEAAVAGGSRSLLMTADAVGGVWSYAVELAGALRAFGYAVHLAVLGPAPSDAQRAQAAAAGATVIETGLALDWLAADAGEVARAGAAVAALAAARGVDVVQLNQPALAAADFAMPVLAVVHSCVASWWDAVEEGPLPSDFAWQTGLVARGLARADAVACPSAAFAATVQRLYALRERPAAIHNGRSATPSGTEAPGAFAFTAGRLWDRGKDAATLDRAAALMPVPLRAAGPAAGPDGSRVTLSHLELLGSLDHHGMAAQLAARPVFVSAARYEPFGLSVLEAALAGCALVLSDIATFRELWDGDATFVAPGDAAGFAHAVTMLTAHPATRAEAGERARARAARYSPAAMARGTAALLNRIVEQSARAAA